MRKRIVLMNLLLSGCASSRQPQATEQVPDDGYHGLPPEQGDTGEDLPGEWAVEDEGTVLETLPSVHGECSSAEPYAVSWNGDEILIAYGECSGESVHVPRVMRLDRVGRQIGEPVEVPGMPLQGGASIPWTDVRWAAVFDSSRAGETELFLRPIEGDLTLGDELRLTTKDGAVGLGGAAWLGAAWLGETLGIVANGTYRRADPFVGVDASSVRAIDAESTESILTVNGRLVVAFASIREGQYDPYVSVVDASGEPETASAIKLAATEQNSGPVLVAWTGDGFLAAFREDIPEPSGSLVPGVSVVLADGSGQPIDGSLRLSLPHEGESGPATDDDPSGSHDPIALVATGNERILLVLRSQIGDREHAPSDLAAFRLDSTGAPDPDGPTVIASSLNDLTDGREASVRAAWAVAMGPAEIAVVWDYFDEGDEYGDASFSRIGFARLVLR